MRVAVVTGGGRGVGRAIALELADDGFHLHIVARGREVFGPLARVGDGDAQAWVNTLLTNTVGSYLTCRALVGGMVSGGWGRVVNVTSAAAVGPPSPFNSAYTTSKVALNWFTRCLALELEGTGVTANTLHPGEVQTEMWRDIGAQADRLGPDGNGFRDWAAMVGRTGGDPPQKAAAMVRWLVDDQQRSINGELLWLASGLQAPIQPTTPAPYVVEDL